MPKGNPKPVMLTMPDGQVREWPSRDAACESLGLSCNTVRARHRRTGSSFEDAFLHLAVNGVQKHNRDYDRTNLALGQEFPCSLCDRILPALDFRVQGVGSHRKRPSRSSHCRMCEWAKASKRPSQEGSFAKSRKIRIHPHRSYCEFLEDQDYQCLICGCEHDWENNVLCIDHDHETGFVCGLLCRECNKFEGKLDTHLDKVPATIDYITRNREKRECILELKALGVH